MQTCLGCAQFDRRKHSNRKFVTSPVQAYSCFWIVALIVLARKAYQNLLKLYDCVRWSNFLWATDWLFFITPMRFIFVAPATAASTNTHIMNHTVAIVIIAVVTGHTFYTLEYYHYRLLCRSSDVYRHFPICVGFVLVVLVISIDSFLIMMNNYVSLMIQRCAERFPCCCLFEQAQMSNLYEMNNIFSSIEAMFFKQTWGWRVGTIAISIQK